MMTELQEKEMIKTTYRKDYTPPSFLIDRVDLHFKLTEEETEVTSTLTIRRSETSSGNELRLNGEELNLLSVEMNDVPLIQSQYRVDENGLTIFNPPDVLTLKTVVHIFPNKNATLSGLYRSEQTFCTQCESEGFRRITYFLDRPDVLSLYTTTIVADRKHYPMLLSNGDCIMDETLSDGWHAATWHDPFKKPCYLFALVAGHFDVADSHFMTKSKRKVSLQIYVEPGLLDQTKHAMDSLKAAMAWDELRYGREYDLDRYMIVAISDFNAGAMENKGLNIFNTQYILAKPETASDNDFIHISSVIAHEYFHNWTGNRVTCRDWFQLSLKEGLTIFRDQSFSEDFISPGVMRIRDVQYLREKQFLEDAGPLAHPVRPDAYLKIDNFYTSTIYNKGAEVLRMLETMLGRPLFREAMDLYFQRFDGQAVTIDDYILIMEEVSGLDLMQFKLWYSQAGTPLVTVHDEYDAATRKYRLICEQTCPKTPEQPMKLPMHIPIRIGLLTESGENIPLTQNQAYGHPVLHLKEAKQFFEFDDIPSRPIPSLLRHFSAPVKIQYQYKDEHLIQLALHDEDAFNRYEALQQYLIRVLLHLIDAYQHHMPLHIPSPFIDCFSRLLNEKQNDLFFYSTLITIPSESYIGEQMQVIDVEAIHAAREFLLLELSMKLEPLWQTAYQTYNNKLTSFEFSVKQIGMRQFKNRCFHFLLHQIKHIQLAVDQFEMSFKNNMTDQLASLAALSHLDTIERTNALQQFYQAWSHDALVMDKWLSIQAASQRQGVIDDIKMLLLHPVFDLKNPNKVYALLGTFGYHNPLYFHDQSGDGYALLRTVVLELDSLNPSIAARMIKPLINWRRYDSHRQQLMQEQLKIVLQNKKLSINVYEIVTKGLEN